RARHRGRRSREPSRLLPRVPPRSRALSEGLGALAVRGPSPARLGPGHPAGGRAPRAPGPGRGAVSAVALERPAPAPWVDRLTGLVALGLYSILAVVVYFQVVGPALDKRLDGVGWADTTVYFDYEPQTWEALLTLPGNYIGPVLLLRLFRHDNFLIALLNCAVLLAAYRCTTRFVPVHASRLAFLLAIN